MFQVFATLLVVALTAAIAPQIVMANTAPSTKPAILECQCGKSSIALANPTPRLCIYCHCPDCRDSVLCCRDDSDSGCSGCSDKNNAKTKNKKVKDEEEIDGMVLTYFDNDLTVLKGEENLRLCKLRSGGDSTRCFASCCDTLLFSHHYLYKNNVIMVPRKNLVGGSNNGVKITYRNPTTGEYEQTSSSSSRSVKENMMKPSYRIQTKWRSANLPPLPKNDIPSYDSSDFTWPIRSGILQTFNQRPKYMLENKNKQREGKEGFDELFKRIERNHPIIVVNHPKSKLPPGHVVIPGVGMVVGTSIARNVAFGWGALISVLVAFLKK